MYTCGSHVRVRSGYGGPFTDERPVGHSGTLLLETLLGHTWDLHPTSTNPSLKPQDLVVPCHIVVHSHRGTGASEVGVLSAPVSFPVRPGRLRVLGSGKITPDSSHSEGLQGSSPVLCHH